MMKKFGLFLLKLLVLIFALMYFLDCGYTYVYSNAKPRNNLQYIRQLNHQKFDIVFLGSSRVANHIDSELFDQLSQKKTINLGVQGANLADNLLQLKLLLSKNKVDYLFLQIDANLEIVTTSNISQAEAIPYINEPIIDAHIKQFVTGYNALKYTPFYRYAVNDAKLGFRELFFTTINKKPAVDPSKGFTPMFGNSIPTGSVEPLKEKHKLKINPILLEIKQLCKVHHVDLVLFISPFCSKIYPDDYIIKMKTFEPNLIDLTKGYDDALFFNCGHLNQKGAEVFTRNLYLSTKELWSSK